MTEQTKEQTPFRIGGIYRTGRWPVKLTFIPPAFVDHWTVRYPGHTFVLAERIDNGEAAGYVSLQTGRYVGAFDQESHIAHLIPGECDESGRPIEAQDDKSQVGTLGALLRKALFRLDEGYAAQAKPSEPKRAPLDWAKSTPFDNFKGFETDKWSIENDLYTNSSSPLQRLQESGHQTPAVCGSVGMLKG